MEMEEGRMLERSEGNRGRKEGQREIEEGSKLERNEGNRGRKE